MISYCTNANMPAEGARGAEAASALAQASGGGNGDGPGNKPPYNVVDTANDEPDHLQRDGDIIYGGRAIADFIFPNEPKRDRARRRVFNLAAYYFARKEKAGFFKLNGALCLSKKQWRSFHGLS